MDSSNIFRWYQIHVAFRLSKYCSWSFYSWNRTRMYVYKKKIIGAMYYVGTRPEKFPFRMLGVWDWRMKRAGACDGWRSGDALICRSRFDICPSLALTPHTSSAFLFYLFFLPFHCCFLIFYSLSSPLPISCCSSEFQYPDTCCEKNIKKMKS